MVVMTAEVVDVMVSDDAVYRRGSEQNARQQHDELPADTTPNTRSDTQSQAGVTFRPDVAAG
jgi:hypothetical protein